MKNTINLFTLILLVSVILFSGCRKRDDDPGVDLEAQQRARLAKTWVPETPVTFDGAADTRFQGFEITFAPAGTYTSQSGGPVFRSSGTWAFKENTNFNTLVLDGRPEFVISSLTDTNLNGTVNLTGGVNARTTGIDGTYVFNLRVK